MILAVLLLAAATPLAPVDSGYLTRAMQSQLGRYALASVAEKNGATASLKAFAHAASTKATMNTRTLDALAKRHGVAVESQPGVRDRFHYARLMGVHGTDFDRSFVQQVRIDDAIMMSDDKAEMREGRDTQVRTFAKKRYAQLQNELAVLGKLRL
jgi:Domain of unknown function (DUF4142)